MVLLLPDLWMCLHERFLIFIIPSEEKQAHGNCRCFVAKNINPLDSNPRKVRITPPSSHGQACPHSLLHNVPRRLRKKDVANVALARDAFIFLSLISPYSKRGASVLTTLLG